MKAIILNTYGSVDNFQMDELPVPMPQVGQIRIRIKAISFNPVDYQIRRGSPESSRVTSNILGMDLSGIVDELGEGAKEFRIW